MKRTLIITLFTICCLLINSINFWNASCHGNECIQKYNERIEIYNDALEKEDYITCLNALEEALKYSDYRKEELNEQIRNIAEYLWWVSSQNEDYSEALKYYKKALEISEKAETLYNIWWICYKLGKYKTWITYLEKAKQKTQDSELYEGIVKLLNYMTEMSEYEDDKENRKTNDEYWFYQYYLSWINIFEAREKLPQNTNKVIIAIIDDGVNINHPDLKNKVRTNKNEIPW
jgi:tetratricopeptide (TPR) repeat protein